MLFAILQKYDFSSKSQPQQECGQVIVVVCDTAKVRFFKQITTRHGRLSVNNCCLRYCKSTIFQANHNVISATFSAEPLFAILQKYDFSSKSQQERWHSYTLSCCLWYCKSTIFQANHNNEGGQPIFLELFVILQKYDFSSKSQLGMLLILIEVVLTFNGSINWVEFIFFVW